jgi:hypothetical protein
MLGGEQQWEEWIVVHLSRAHAIVTLRFDGPHRVWYGV